MTFRKGSKIQEGLKEEEPTAFTIHPSMPFMSHCRQMILYFAQKLILSMKDDSYLAKAVAWIEKNARHKS